MVVLVISQLFAGAGIAAGLSAGALLAQDLFGNDALTGLPFVFFSTGSACASLLIGRISQKRGRRPGLSSGFFLGCIGAVGIIVFTIISNVVLFFVMLFIYGAGSATALQARYAGTDLAKPMQKATSVGIVLIASSFGVFVSPLFTDALSALAVSWGASDKVGVFIIASIGYLISGSIVCVFMRPDPLLTARALESQASRSVKQSGSASSESDDGTARERRSNRQKIILGVFVMTVAFVVMILIMTMTPLHMQHHDNDMTVISWVISIHLAAMYLPSLFSGMIVDKLGALRTAELSGVVLLLSGVLAALATNGQLVLMIVSLTLLGVGWNFGFISGTAIVLEGVAPEKRAKQQGRTDVFIALAGAAAGFFSGVILAGVGFVILALFGSAIALAMLVLVFVISRKRQVP